MATELELFRDTVNHHRPQRLLYHFGTTPDLQHRLKAHIGGKDINEYYGLFEPAWIPMNRPASLPPLDYSRYWEGETLPEGTTIGEFGVASVPSGFYHFVGYISPLRNATSLKEIEDFPMDDFSTWDLSYMPKLVEEQHRQGKVIRAWAGHMYEVAWQIRGYEQFLMDMIDRPSWAQCLLDRLASNNRVRATAFAKAGADWILCGDDVANQNAMMFSPDMWREFMLSRWGKTWGMIKEINPDTKIWYHSDGNILSIIPDLIEAGLDILNPLQPEALDVDQVHRRFGRKLNFDGVIGTQSTMPWGKPADVKARVKEVIDKYGREGGLIVAPSHDLEPEVPIENIEAFVEACREYKA